MRPTNSNHGTVNREKNKMSKRAEQVIIKAESWTQAQKILEGLVNVLGIKAILLSCGAEDGKFQYQIIPKKRLYRADLATASAFCAGIAYCWK